MNFLLWFKSKPETGAKEAAEHYYRKAQDVKDTYRKSKLLQTASEYFEEANDYDRALECLFACNETDQARALCVKIDDPKLFQKYATNKSQVIKTYLACIVKCINRDLLYEASQQGKELLDYHRDDFTESLFAAVTSLVHFDLEGLSEALIKIHESGTELIDDETQSLLINLFFDKCRGPKAPPHLHDSQISAKVIPDICPICRGKLGSTKKHGEQVCLYCGTRFRIA